MTLDRRRGQAELAAEPLELLLREWTLGLRGFAVLLREVNGATQDLAHLGRGKAMLAEGRSVHRERAYWIGGREGDVVQAESPRWEGYRSSSLIQA